jgi:hypothetical protein
MITGARVRSWPNSKELSHEDDRRVRFIRHRYERVRKVKAMRFARVILILMLLTAACGFTDRRNAQLGPASDSCLATMTDCSRSHQCCSQWCVNGVCETRE